MEDACWRREIARACEEAGAARRSRSTTRARLSDLTKLASPVRRRAACRVAPPAVPADSDEEEFVPHPRPGGAAAPAEESEDEFVPAPKTQLPSTATSHDDDDDATDDELRLPVLAVRSSQALSLPWIRKGTSASPLAPASTVMGRERSDTAGSVEAWGEKSTSRSGGTDRTFSFAWARPACTGGRTPGSCRVAPEDV